MLPKRSRKILGLVGLTLGACVDPQEPPPLTITLTATPTSVSVGQSVSIRADAAGFDIVRIAVELGDGASEVVDFPLLTSANVAFQHAFPSPGAYDVVAIVTNFQRGQDTSTVRVTVSGAAP